MNADQLPTTRKSILETLKREGKAAIADLAGRLGMSGEAVRQQLLQLQREGWVEAIRDEAHEKRSGRPAAHYRLTPAGDHLFPKDYDNLGIALLIGCSASGIPIENASPDTTAVQSGSWKGAVNAL